MLLIGSTALRIQLEKAGMGLDRTPVDLDFLAYPDEVNSVAEAWNLSLLKMGAGKFLFRTQTGQMVEIETARPGTSTELYLQWAKSMTRLETTSFYGTLVDVAPAEMLFSLKKAHRHSPRHFEKHVRDYNLLREFFNEFVVGPFSRVTELRYRETVEREKLRTPSLNKSTKDFFNDNVSNRTFIHDQIHEVMAHEARPLFENIKIDPEKVACSKDKFFSLSTTHRRQCVQEEAYVIALERCIIPMLFEGGKLVRPFDAYKWAVMRICTTLCSGWFREYALEHYRDLIIWYDEGYVEKFLKAVESGRIERIK